MSAIKISPSAEDTSDASLNARLMPPGGRPRLSSTMSSSFAGIVARTTSSTSAKRRALSSSRVPAGQRTWRRSCPASTVGKKSMPISQKRPSDNVTNPAKSAATMRR